MAKSKFNSTEMSEIDWDLFRYYRLGSLNLIEVRNLLKSLLNAYLNNTGSSNGRLIFCFRDGTKINLSKVQADAIFRFLQEINLAYVKPNKKSVLHRVGKEARK